MGTSGSLEASIRASQYFAPHPQTKRSEFCVRELRLKGGDTSNDTRAWEDAAMEQTRIWRGIYSPNDDVAREFHDRSPFAATRFGE
jgi:hypothetical protein